MIDFKAQAEAMREELVARRRDFHKHPELAFEEVRTAGIVAEELRKLGMEVQTGVGKTGVVAILEGDQDGPTVLVRADMDALPILEQNDTEYVSSVPGKMHACGHDGHTTIALGVARLLSQYRDQIAGRVKFVFQPAEEIGQGAKAMVNDGVLQNPRPDVSLGLHLWNTVPVGILGVADGPVMAGSSDFRIVLTGKGAHGALPHEGHDPITCAAQIVMALQTIISRNLNPLDSAVLSVTYLHSGTATNIIPQTAELKGTIRTFRLEVRDFVSSRVHEVADSVSRAMGCSAEVDIIHYTNPVINNADVAARLRPVLGRYISAQQIDLTERTMGAEDMGYLMSDVPGLFFFVGSANAERGLNYGHHHPRFDFDEDALPLGVALMSAAVAEYVLPEA